MAKSQATRSAINTARIPASIKKLERRLKQLEDVPDVDLNTDLQGLYRRIVADVNATIDDVFGEGTADAHDFYIKTDWFFGLYADATRQLTHFSRGMERAKQCVRSAVARLKEKQEDAEIDEQSRTIKAYRGLELHPGIADAASALYLDGHYANAVEDAVKALNSLVRMRSKTDDRDGISLMEAAFNPTTPKLKFNDLLDQSDKDEQKGYMMMFCGAVAGLRNPRAHRLIQDDPERALEFIAFVSLLAKLLDGAKRTTN